jgi:peptidoglycan-N-acetylglucosamine deacetylase
VTRFDLTIQQRFSGLLLLASLGLGVLSGGWGGMQFGLFLQQHILSRWSPNPFQTAQPPDNLTGNLVENLANKLADKPTGQPIAQPPDKPTKPPERVPVNSLTPLVVQVSQPEVTRLQQQQAAAQAAAQAEAEKQRLTYRAPDSFKGAIVRSAQLKVARDAIALTFDDGPWDETTGQILDILRQENVKATFFWVAQAAQNQQELARRVVNEGHAIGNHTWHHPYEAMDTATAAREIDGAAKIFNEITGIHTTLFRPPGGYLNNGLTDYAISQGYTVVLWSAESRDTDYTVDAQSYINNVLASATPGGIVLMHDGGGDRSKTVAALPTIIKTLKAQGYRFVTVPELLKLEANGW